MFRVEIRDCSSGVGKGWIQIGDFAESFEMVFEFWSPQEYQRHWIEAIRRMVDGAEVGALVTSVTNPDTANFLFWWPMYREGNRIIFQNQILFLTELEQPFRLEEYVAFVPRRETINEDGDKISEWAVPLADLKGFLRILPME